MDINNIASIYTIAAFYIVWLAFYVERRNRLQQRKEEKIDTLKSIDNELYLMRGWFGGSYIDLSYPLVIK